MAARIRLQERDLDVLHSLGIARYLTVQAIEWLHYPAWRERWTKYQDDADTAKRGYYPIPNLYRRMEGLRGSGYVVSIKRTVEQATTTFNRLADVYALTEAGAELLADQRQVDFADLVVEGQRPRSLKNLEHTVQIAALYAALRAELDYTFKDRPSKLLLSGWHDDRTLSQADLDSPQRRYDKVRSGGDELPVLPDATFQLAIGDRSRRYFVELDRGTRPIPTWREKARAYTAYRQSTALQARYSVNDFVLLVVAPTPRRLERIAEQIVKIHAEPGLGVRLLESRFVHPVSIQGRWQSIASATKQQRVTAGKIMEYAAVTMHTELLWI